MGEAEVGESQSQAQLETLKQKVLGVWLKWYNAFQ
jgi:hypothetical protein